MQTLAIINPFVWCQLDTTETSQDLLANSNYLFIFSSIAANNIAGCQNGYTDKVGHCFKAFKVTSGPGITRSAAQTACSADGAHLAYLDSNSKQQAAQALFYATYPEVGKQA